MGARARTHAHARAIAQLNIHIGAARVGVSIDAQRILIVRMRLAADETAGACSTVDEGENKNNSKKEDEIETTEGIFRREFN